MSRVLWAAVMALLLAGCNSSEPPARQAARTPQTHLVEAVRVEPRAVALERSRTGTLRAERVVQIYTQAEGRITSLPWHPGDRVHKGDLLATLDDRLLRAQLDSARAATHEAKQNLQRMRQLAERRLVSREELLRRETEAEVAEAEQRLLQTKLSYTRISAPFDAVVTERLSEPGNIAGNYTHLLTLADPDALVVDVTVSELVLSQLKVGDPVSVVVDALGRSAYSARISRIYPDVDPVTRRGTLEIRLVPVPRGARPGQFVRVELKTAARDRLLVPFNALRFDKGTYLYLVEADGKVAQRSVVTGSRLADSVEILQGLTPGERVVTRGFLGLSPGKAVTVVSTAEASDEQP